MFHTDDEFLREVVRQPSERTLRLVYADWLDERDDARGESIRVEEEMRTAISQASPRWARIRNLSGRDVCPAHRRW
jgi:uncharacterized protein (TIGR02996 family)